MFRIDFAFIFHYQLLYFCSSWKGQYCIVNPCQILMNPKDIHLLVQLRNNLIYLVEVSKKLSFLIKLNPVLKKIRTAISSACHLIMNCYVNRVHSKFLWWVSQQGKKFVGNVSSTTELKNCANRRSGLPFTTRKYALL